MAADKEAQTREKKRQTVEEHCTNQSEIPSFLLFPKYCQRNYIKADKMGEHVACLKKMGNYAIFVEEPERDFYVEIMLKFIFKYLVVTCGELL